MHQDIGATKDPEFATHGQTSMEQVREAGFSVVGTTTYMRVPLEEYRPMDEEVVDWYEQQMLPGERIIRTVQDLPESMEEPLRLLLIQEGFTVPEPATLQAVHNKLDKLYDAGVRVLQPVYAGYFGHQKHPDGAGRPSSMGFSTADGSIGWQPGCGLTELGKDTCRIWLERGGILDASHSSPAGLGDMAILCQEYGTPLLISHTASCRYNPNNLRTISLPQCDTLKMHLGDTGFLIGVALVRSLLDDGRYQPAALARWVESVRDIITGVGEHHVALGSDLGGAVNGLLNGVRHAPDIVVLKEVARDFLSDDQCEQVFRENALRFLREALPAS